MTGTATGSIDGLVVVDKPGGMTSHDVVARVRRLAGTRKVGHAGTLDPMATGVLLVGIGRATRLLGHLAGQDKSYLATIRLGVTTTSDDADGEVVDRADASGVDDGAVRRAMQSLTGDIDQVPSSVSAVKVDGERAYARVRRGEEVVLPSRRVTVSAFELLRRDGDALDVRVDCSTGTYIRALARDLGGLLGVGAHLTALRRTRVGGFTVDEAHPLDALADDLAVVPLVDVATRVFPSWEPAADDARRLSLGQRLPPVGLPSGPVAALGPDGALVALVEERDDAVRPAVVFAPGEGGQRDMS
jgi:tRNA pseudouridine55 synthase